MKKRKHLKAESSLSPFEWRQCEQSLDLDSTEFSDPEFSEIKLTIHKDLKVCFKIDFMTTIHYLGLVDCIEGEVNKAASKHLFLVKDIFWWWIIIFIHDKSSMFVTKLSYYGKVCLFCYLGPESVTDCWVKWCLKELEATWLKSITFAEIPENNFFLWR